jgi:IS5 family transposase
MRPMREQDQPQRELFQVELEQMIDLDHPLVRLGLCIDWVPFEQDAGSDLSSHAWRAGISTRLMVALHYLKYQHDLSDEDVVAHWVENPYWQHFSGERYFQHRRLSMGRA